MEMQMTKAEMEIIDDIRIYNGVLTGQEIKAVYNNVTGILSAKGNEISLYPNPANRFLYLKGININATITILTCTEERSLTKKIWMTK
jgi:hypothetical protein